MQQHELSAAFPRMSDDDFDALKASIEKIGVQSPAVVYDGQIIDGWHRYTACQRIGMKCPTVDMPANVDPRDFVMAQNKARRHTTQAQLAMAATAVYAWVGRGGDRKSKGTECPLIEGTEKSKGTKGGGLNQHNAARVGTECPSSKHQKSAAEIASVAGVGVRSVKQAKEVQTKATPEVVQAVKDGVIGLPKAAEIAKLPKAEQAAAIDKPLPKKQPAPVEHQAPDDATVDLIHSIKELEDENEDLRQRLAIEQYDVSEEAKTEAANLIKEQAQTIKNLRAENEALRASRDGFQFENHELMKQVKMLNKLIKKMESGVA